MTTILLVLMLSGQHSADHSFSVLPMNTVSECNSKGKQWVEQMSGDYIKASYRCVILN